MSEELKSIEIVPYRQSGSLNEIYQKTGVQFSFVSKPNPKSKQCHSWVLCRDFLNDAAWNSHRQKSGSIYGFIYNPATQPAIDHDKMRLIVRVSGDSSLTDDKMLEFVLRANKVLHHYESYAKVTAAMRTRVLSVSNIKGAYAFLGPKLWMSSPFLISMYTLLIRICVRQISVDTAEDTAKAFEEIAKQQKTYGDNDVSYLQSVYKYLHAILDIRKEIRFKRKDGSILMGDQHIERFHNHSGVVALVKYTVPDAGVCEVFKKRVNEK